MFLARKLKTWSEHQLISAEQGQQILTFEKNRGRSRIFFGLGGLGVLSIILGIASLIAANWYKIPPEMRIGSHVALNLLLAFVTLKYFEKPSWIREVLVTLQAGLVLTFIALIGQVLQTQAPLWQPLGFWLLFTTPMLLLYARFFGVVAVWLGIVAVFSVSLCDHALTKEQADVFLPALPFVLYLVFNLKKMRELLPNWSEAIHVVFWVSVVLAATQGQWLWHMSSSNTWWHIPVASVVTAGIGTLTLFLLNVAQRTKRISFWYDELPEWDMVLVVSFVLGALPILVSHPSLEVVGALTFCLYWFFMGGIGLRLGIDRLWTLAVILIGIRLFWAYVEIMGSLAVQGLGFLFSGFFFLGLAYAAKKIIQIKPTWLLAQKKEEVRP